MMLNEIPKCFWVLVLHPFSLIPMTLETTRRASPPIACTEIVFKKRETRHGWLLQ